MKQETAWKINLTILGLILLIIIASGLILGIKQFNRHYDWCDNQRELISGQSYCNLYDQNYYKSCAEIPIPYWWNIVIPFISVIIIAIIMLNVVGQMGGF